MAEETNYKLSEHNLDIPADLAFVDGLLQDHGLEAEPQTRGFILDLAYSKSL